MKEYYFESISAVRTFAYYLFAFFFTITCSIFSKKVTDSNVAPVIVFIGLGIALFFLGKKVICRYYNIKVSNKLVHVNNKLFDLQDLKSFDFDFTGHVETITLRFKNQKLRFNNPYKSKHRSDFLNFQRTLKKKIEGINQGRPIEEAISQQNFYNSRYAMPFAYLMIGIMLIWIIIMITQPEKFKLSNFSLFLIVLSGLLPMLNRIRLQKKKIG